MRNTSKVNIFLGIICVLAIIIAIFALNRGEYYESDTSEYEVNICNLKDTIKALKEDIAQYKIELERIDSERKSIKKDLDIIIKDNEKVDSELANGDWDSNIKFLTEFLSEEDSDRIRHRSRNNKGTDGHD